MARFTTFVTALIAVLIAAPPNPGAAQDPLPNPLDVKLDRGFGSDVYFVPTPKPAPPSVCPPAGPTTPSPQPSATPAPFFAGAVLPPINPDRTIARCAIVSVAPSTSGLTVSFVLLPPDKRHFVSVTPVDGTPMSSAESRVSIALDAPNATGARFFINPGGHLDQRLSDGTTRLPVLLRATGANPAPSGALPDPAPSDAWSGSVTIPWPAFPDHPTSQALGNCNATLSVALALPDQDAGVHPAIAATLTRLCVSLDDGNAFADAAVPSAQRQRFVAFSDVETTPLVTPTTSPVPVPPLDERIAADVNVPFRRVRVGYTGNQNDAALEEQKAKTIAAVTANLPASVPTPAPCGSCQQFQTLYGDVFALGKGSDVASLLKGAKYGTDDQPFSFANIPNLSTGTVLQYANGNLKAGLSYLHIAADESKAQALLDGSFGAKYSAGPNTYNVLAAVSNRPGIVPTPLPGAVPAFPVVAHAAQYAASWVADYPNDVALRDYIATDLIPVVRVAFDTTDKASIGYAGVQWSRTATAAGRNDKTWQSGTFSALVGYRHADISFAAPDGDTISYPGQSGVTASAEYAMLRSNAMKQPDIKLSGYWLSNPNGDVARSVDGIVSSDVSPSFGLSYEYSQLRVSQPLIAFQSLTATPTYPQLRTLMALDGTANLTTVLPLWDSVLTVIYKPPSSLNLQLGYEFGHASTNCYLPPAPAAPIAPATPAPAIGPFCDPVTVSHPLTVGGFAKTGTLTIGGSYAPALIQSGSRYAAARRVYNAFLSGAFTDCTALLITASNDTGQLGTQNRLKRAVNAELDIEKFSILPVLNDWAALVVGYSDVDNDSPGTATFISGNAYSLPYTASATRQVFVKLRVGSPGFKQALSPKCGG
jgi:hypothetical protein